MTEYYFIKYRDRVLGINHKGYCTEEAKDRIFSEMGTDGYTRNTITALVGALPFDFVTQQRRVHKTKLIVS